MNPPSADERRSITFAADILRRGGLVAFPTETVYGLGADARNSAAVAKIFAAKGRPAGNPLIVHIAEISAAPKFANWNPIAQKLAEKFWPGPLALVLPKSDAIVPEVTSGRNSVALRMPNHPIALALLREFGGPVAAPSANRSNHVSPTTAQHVRDDLGNRIDLILDGGSCTVGIESTVLDLTQSPPMILRLGGVSRSAIEEMLGVVDVFHGSTDIDQSAPSPGQHARHYAPATPAYRYTGGTFHKDRANIVVLAINRAIETLGNSVIPMPANPAEYAARFYAALRHADALHADAIWIEEPPDTAEWQAVRDRIQRATLPKIDFSDAKRGHSRL
ncbi:MAG: L-threonylcarbamoyladenylate synthase [Tepidisphaeraceae bacterium]|jgi:L-threonylcarbamoyladenylate synthase